jgi:acyl-CoA thioester hydrolase
MANPEIENRKSKIDSLLRGCPVVVELPVAWGEMDSYQHVNNVVYFRYFENVRLEYFRRLGWFELEEETGVGPILAATQARFRRPLTYPDTISVGAHITGVAADRFTMHYRLVSHRLEEVAADGQGTIVCYHYGKQHKAPLAEVLRQRIADLESGAH